MSGGPIEAEGGLSFKLLGFPVRLHPSALLIVGLVVLMHIKGGPEMATWGAIYGFVILLSVLIHELGHAVAGRWLGMGPLDITIHGFGGYTRATRGRGPKRGLVMTAAGPAAGLVLGVVSYAVYYLYADQASATVYWTLRRLWEVNLFWSLFNLLPMVPMDGGLILRQGLTVMGARGAEEIARWISIVTAVAVGAAAFYVGQTFLGLFAIYILSKNVNFNRG